MEENNYKKLLDDTDHIIFVSDMNTLEILYGNKNVLNYGHRNGILPEGLTCYEYFMGLDKPCEFCPVAQLEKNHEDLVLRNWMTARIYFVQKQSEPSGKAEMLLWFTGQILQNQKNIMD